jgi:hypothetical protein|tara:strand:- start:8724 stop:9230 length:507 start_codon:yes stop_codon:yes gene_type:complete
MKKIDSYSLTKETVNSIISPLFNKTFVNAKTIEAIIINSLSSNDLELIMTLLHSNEPYKPLKVGSIFRVQKDACTYFTGMAEDKLLDLNLLKYYDNIPYVYGSVLCDDSYNSSKENFNPFYWKMKVELYGIDLETDEFKVITDTLYTRDIIKTHKVPFKISAKESKLE